MVAASGVGVLLGLFVPQCLISSPPLSLSLSLSECVVVRLLKSMHADSTGRDDDDSIYTYITRQTDRPAGRTPVAIADKQLLLPICMAAAAIRQTIAN